MASFLYRLIAGRSSLPIAEAATSGSRYPKNPALNLSRLAIMRFNFRAEELFETAIAIRPAQPFGGRIGVLLVGRSPCASESPAPKRRVNLNDHRAIGPHAPTVERPGMDMLHRVLPCLAVYCSIRAGIYRVVRVARGRASRYAWGVTRGGEPI